MAGRVAVFHTTVSGPTGYEGQFPHTFWLDWHFVLLHVASSTPSSLSQSGEEEPEETGLQHSDPGADGARQGCVVMAARDLAPLKINTSQEHLVHLALQEKLIYLKT